MRWLASSTVVLLAGLQGVSACAAVPVAGPATIAEQYLFAAANAERTQRGLPTLRWDAALYQAADAHAREMAARESISHQYPGEMELAGRGRQAGVRFSVIAENVAEAPTAVRIHDAWMASEGHRANLLNAQVDAVGIRVVQRSGQLYAVEDFARSVVSRTLAEQESAVGSLVEGGSAVKVLPTSDETRRTCTMESGYAGQRRPGFVMRYTTANLEVLPDELKRQLATGRYEEAEIGACTMKEHAAFSAFRLVVLLYP